LHEVEIKEKLRDAFKTRTEPSAPHGASILIMAQKLKEVKQNSENNQKKKFL
jgi:hypothetical protein